MVEDEPTSSPDTNLDNQNEPTKDSSSKKQRQVRDFWPRYRRRARTITVLVQLTITTAAGIALILSGVEVDSMAFISSVISVSVLTLVVNLYLVSVLLTPLRDVSAALTHVSGEPTDMPPPNPNVDHLEDNSLRPLLATIYRLSLESTSSGKNVTTNEGSGGLLETAFNRINAGIVIMKGSGEIIYASPAAPVKTDNNGSLSLELIFESDQPFEIWRQESVGKLVRAEKTWQRIANRLADDSKRRFFDILASYESGSEAEIVLVFNDQTDLYQPEEDQLNFISFAAHELRGPVTVIRGYLDVLSQEIGDQLEPNHNALIDRLTVSANRLSTYINNILNASRYDRRHLKLHLGEYHLSDIYNSITDDLSLRASTHNRVLSVSIPDDLPTVAADPASLAEVFANLIDNALKYSHEGGEVKVQAEVDGDFVKVSVIDSGIGIPANVMQNLFHKFYRSHRSRETVAGTGIGLYISKAIIDSHGGVIEAKSQVDKGSTFTFSLPIYATVADKLADSGSSNVNLVRSSSGGWIKNHAKIRG